MLHSIAINYFIFILNCAKDFSVAAVIIVIVKDLLFNFIIN